RLQEGLFVPSYRRPVTKLVISESGGSPVTSSLSPPRGILLGGLPQTNERVAIIVRDDRSTSVMVQLSWMARDPISYRPTSCRAWRIWAIVVTWAGSWARISSERER